MKRLPVFFLLCSFGLWAHPMGNFSVNHYTKIEVTGRGVQVRYVLDLAEIPTFELLRSWNIDRNAAPAELQAHGKQQSREWLKHIRISVDGRLVQAQFESARVTIADGAGNLPITRVDMTERVGDTRGGKLKLEDQNFSERAGWKEIVIDAGSGAALVHASQSGKDLSKALTEYPPDPTVAPPQDLRAEVEWRSEKPVVVTRSVQRQASSPIAGKPVETVVAKIAQPTPVRGASSPVTMTAQAAPPGSVVRGDFLSRILHRRELTVPIVLLAILAAFGLGAAHALTPGHGKTIVAAYLVGSRGTLKHAAFLGAMVTFTHTIAVFALGLATLFLFRYIVPEKITLVLGAISGLSIVGVGAWMLYKRLTKKGHSHSSSHGHTHTHEHPQAHSHEHPHTHSHEHPHAHSLEHPDEHVHAHQQDHVHEHQHGGHTHSHVPDEISWGGLVALGVSGGLVPCESALILLLGAIALGRVGFGLILLLSFSVGLAIVLMLIGMLVLYAKELLPESTRSGNNSFFRVVSIASPALVIIVGLVMTGVSLGWIQSKWMIG